MKDKIIAYPKGQQFRWTMLNLGEVDIRGIDVVTSLYLPLEELFHLPSLGALGARDALLAKNGQGVGLTLRAQYTYQKSIDVTDSRKPFYRHQIPYIPEHSGSLIVGLDYKRWSLNYSFLYTGERWNAQVNNDYNYMQPWYTSDLTASYRFSLKKADMRLSLEANNLFDQQYDVIANYPMPGRNFTLGLEMMF